MRSELPVLTSESVSEGHPDKVCDYIADSILDAHLAEDPYARVACEVLCKGEQVIVAGEITSAASVDLEATVRAAIRAIGYTDPAERFNADNVRITKLISGQARQLGYVVADNVAGDQGIMFGYASDETAELMPLPILLAHNLARRLADDRKRGARAWLRPDAKTQVSVAYDGNTPVSVETVLVSTQHAAEVSQDNVHAYVTDLVVPEVLGRWHTPEVRILVNPSKSFVEGGPSADCGVTGRKIIVDTYGGAGHHGGGAFSGKDPSKVDRSGAYFARYVARQIVREGLAHRCEVQIAYAIGQAEPVSVRVDTLGTGTDSAAARYMEKFDFRPGEIIERFDLRRPFYRSTTNYGHFGRPGFPWENS